MNGKNYESVFKDEARCHKATGETHRSDFIPSWEKFNAYEELARAGGDSRNQVHRYIRLTYLVPELLELVDNGRMKMQPAVELSYLDEEAQRDIVDIIDETDVFPSFSQFETKGNYSVNGRLFLTHTTQFVTDFFSPYLL